MIISTGPCSIIFPMANYKTEKTLKTNRLQMPFFSGKTKNTYINIVNVQDLGVELKPHGFGLLNWVCKLAVGLQKRKNHYCPVTFSLYLAIEFIINEAFKVKSAPESHCEADIPLHNTSPSTPLAPPGSSPAWRQHKHQL